MYGIRWPRYSEQDYIYDTLNDALDYVLEMITEFNNDMCDGIGRDDNRIGAMVYDVSGRVLFETVLTGVCDSETYHYNELCRCKHKFPPECQLRKCEKYDDNYAWYTDGLALAKCYKFIKVA